MSSPKDKQELVLNPATGQLDVINKFNSDRILTHSNNASGNPLMIYDPFLDSYQEMGDLIVTDNQGNVVTT